MSKMVLRRLILLFRGMAGLATRLASLLQRVEVRLASQNIGPKYPRFYRHGEVFTPVDKRNAEALAYKAIELDALVSRSTTFCGVSGHPETVSHLYDASYLADSCSVTGYNIAMLTQAAYDLQRHRLAHAALIIERGHAAVDDVDMRARRAYAVTVYLGRIARLLSDAQIWSPGPDHHGVKGVPQTHREWVEFLESLRTIEEVEPDSKLTVDQP